MYLVLELRVSSQWRYFIKNVFNEQKSHKGIVFADDKMDKRVDNSGIFTLVRHWSTPYLVLSLALINNIKEIDSIILPTHVGAFNPFKPFAPPDLKKYGIKYNYLNYGTF